MKNSMTIAEIHEELQKLGFGVKLEILAQMTPSELRKFLRKARKAYELTNSLEYILEGLQAKVSEKTPKKSEKNT